METIDHIKISLASKSPRRKELLLRAGVNFEVIPINVEETYDSHLLSRDVPAYLAGLKASHAIEIYPDKFILTADSVVIYEDTILEKPKSKQQAIEYLNLLSDSRHEVITSFCLINQSKRIIRSISTNVFFYKIPQSEIIKYCDTTLPYDKAGAYGIQDWLGSRYISHIEGSYENVMGLPVSQVIESIKEF